MRNDRIACGRGMGNRQAKVTLQALVKAARFQALVKAFQGLGFFLTTLETRSRGASSQTRGRGATVASLNNQNYDGSLANDESRGWPIIECVKQKGVQKVLQITVLFAQKILLLGAK